MHVKKLCLCLVSMGSREVQVGLRVVRNACGLAARIRSRSQLGVSSKSDATPVTVADLTVQARVLSVLCRHFPADKFMGEESSATVLSSTPESGLANHVLELLKEDGEEDIRDFSELCQALDLGGETQTRQGRVWVLDPIDGTTGFLQGGQYAVALALLVDGVVEVGFIGCPALPPSRVPIDSGEDPVGSVYYAERGGGTWMVSLQGDGPEKEVHVSAEPEVRLLEAATGAHTSYAHSSYVAGILGWGTESSVRLDSCCKYVLIARGDACVFIKQPKEPYTEKVWDHAAGALVRPDFYFSSWHPSLVLVAPGVCFHATFLGGGVGDGKCRARDEEGFCLAITSTMRTNAIASMLFN